MSATDPALRIALRQMLLDLTYPDAYKSTRWVQAQLDKSAWTETIREGLHGLARRWVATQPQGVERAIRRALGEKIERERVPETTTASLSTGMVREAATQRMSDMETQSIADSSQETTVMRPDIDYEKLDRILADMRTPDAEGYYQPYWFPDDTKRLEQAEKLYRAGQVRCDAFGIYHVQSRSQKGVVYDIDRTCPCKAGQRDKTKWCAHLIATVIHRKMHAPLSGPWPREDELALFTPPPTSDEPRAGTAHRGHQEPRRAQNVSQDIPEPERHGSDSGAPEEVSLGAPPAADESPAPVSEAPSERGEPVMSETMTTNSVTPDVTPEILQKQRTTIRHMLHTLGYKPASVEEYQGIVLTLTDLILTEDNFPAIIEVLQQIIAAKTKPPGPVIPKEHIQKIHGVTTVKYIGLLQQAHDKGLISLTEDWVFNDAQLSLARAVATFADERRFQGCGDATPDNAQRVGLHWRRLALTRAKARALRDALGIEAPADEEME